MTPEQQEAVRKLKRLRVRAQAELVLWCGLHKRSRGYLGGQGMRYVKERLDLFNRALEKIEEDYPQDGQ